MPRITPFLTNSTIPRLLSLGAKFALLSCLLLGSLLAQSCGDTQITIPGCEDCPDKCITENNRAKCVTCKTDEQCRSKESPDKKCNKKNECVCGSDLDCPPSSHCSAERGCVGCLSDTHCTNKDRPVCALDNTCVNCKPNAKESCQPKGVLVCTPGIKTCKAGGYWGPCEKFVRCKNGQKCVKEQCVPSCPTASCKEGGKKCTSAPEVFPGKYEVCTKDSDGCLHWEPKEESCPERQICKNEQCVPFECGKVCQLGATRCVDGNNIQTCKKDDKDCPSWSQKEACPTDSKCRSTLQKCTPCEPNQSQACYTGPKATKDQGICKTGSQICKTDGSGFEKCTKEVLPAKEECDGKDNNCDGTVDEGCDCINGKQKACYTASLGCKKAGTGFTCQGNCRAGSQTCTKGKWGSCQGETLPTSKEACDKKDDNCNGQVDEGCACQPKETQSCGASHKGECKLGTQICSSAGQWGTCTGATSPTTEKCDGKDNDCDGSIDEDFPDKGKTCSVGKGTCQTPGKYACKTDHSGLECPVKPGAPSKEICDNKDNDCDGQIDEKLFQPCYTGKPGTKGKGICKEGQSPCTNGKFVGCLNQVIPSPEICGNQKDDDCDGFVDEQSGRAIQFSGGPDQVAIPSHTGLHLSGSFTIDLWYKLDSLGNRNIGLLLNKHKAKENSSGYHLKIQNDAGKPNCGFSWWNNNGGNQILFGICPVGTWTHIALTYDKNTKQYRFYINGKLSTKGSGTANISIGSNAHPLLFASETPPSQPPVSDVSFRGQFGAVRISSNVRYTKAFTPACTWKTDTNTGGLWNLEDGGGQTAKDASNTKDGIITGTKWTIGRSCNTAQNGGCTP